MRQKMASLVAQELPLEVLERSIPEPEPEPEQQGPKVLPHEVPAQAPRQVASAQEAPPAQQPGTDSEQEWEPTQPHPQVLDSDPAPGSKWPSAAPPLMQAQAPQEVSAPEQQQEQAPDHAPAPAANLPTLQRQNPAHTAPEQKDLGDS